MVDKDTSPPKHFAPRFIRKSKHLSITPTFVDGKQVLSIRRTPSSGSPTLHIFYFHGGGYKLNATSLQWRFVMQLVMQIQGIMVTMVDYPLARDFPDVVCVDNTIPMVINTYRILTNRYQGCSNILMGDSAGGGLALALALLLGDGHHGHITPPVLNVLLSPWVDLEGTDAADIAAIEPKDVLLSQAALDRCALLYKGTSASPLGSPLMSPINGRLVCAGRTVVFIGTSDILYPAVARMRVLTRNLPFTYHVYQHMPHDWMMYQRFGMPESLHATDKIVEILEGVRRDT